VRKRVENEVCYACPTVSECSERVRDKYLRQDHCLWRELAALLDEQYELLRDARNLYRSRASDERPTLETMSEGGSSWQSGDGEAGGNGRRK
jgi:hypothetical protein